MSNEIEDFESLFMQAIKDAGYNLDELAGKSYDDVFYNITAMMQKKIEEKDERIKQLEADIIEFVDLGTDQYVTEKIVRLEKQNAELMEELKTVKIFLANAVDRSVLEFINQTKRMEETLAKFSEKGER